MLVLFLFCSENPFQWQYILHFLFCHIQFVCFMLRSLILLELSFVHYYKGLFTLFYMQLSSFTKPLIEDAVLFNVYFWLLYENSGFPSCVFLCLGLQFFPLINISVFVPIPHCLFYHISVVELSSSIQLLYFHHYHYWLFLKKYYFCPVI